MPDSDAYAHAKSFVITLLKLKGWKPVHGRMYGKADLKPSQCKAESGNEKVCRTPLGLLHIYVTSSDE
jgi:hypothetical protein